ncbi:type I-G CRISPR-associated protein Cas8g1/Csx17 [Roseospira visakhapatnamensis]|uniref:CRISPR-associated protein Csx17 n=1 Tax=Roseospira visakhapatnamensis TaxID=390880 RepID=A0A7W6WAH4_9PROT|nr:type I-U CRISPR-associated protein Csx17 [Roseospira visakhapatnamensis]MBB4266974.1 CRISPR-associated protein Csx17 [Roseospira visakhapatnamensis]
MTDTPTATVHQHRLEGCTPTPLAGYLKALGVLRLLSTPENSVTGTAADPTARGFWRNEAFHLESRLDREALTRFFLEDYAPSPIVAPWNADSGFYGAAGKTKATTQVATLATAQAGRLKILARSIRAMQSILSELQYTEAPSKQRKVSFIERVRTEAENGLVSWLDAGIVALGDNFDAAAVLGSGGNDGRLDYSSTFHRSLLQLFEAESGSATDTAETCLDVALMGANRAARSRTGLSQFSPGRLVAPNAGTGFSGDSGEDPWSVTLLIEGALTLAGTASRHGEAHRPRGSFPFTVSHRGAGSGAVVLADEDSNRAREIWLPLWTRPALYAELRALFAEGRAHIGERAARDGLSFARAVASMGVNRGIDSFERVGFEARYGNMFITAPLGRFYAPRPGQTSDDLIADLDRGEWLSRVRSMARGGTAPARAKTAVRRLEDALFLMTSANRRKDGARAALMALGEVVDWMTHSKEARETLSPPPRLRADWVWEADDGSAEFRVAAALASLGWGDGSDPDAPRRKATADPEDADPPTDSAPAHPPDDGIDAGGDGDEQDDRSPWPRWQKQANRLLPLAGQLVPLNLGSVYADRRQWYDAKSPPTDPTGKRYPSTEPLAVWGAGGLARNMVAVLERRLIEQAMRGLEDKPLAAAAPARLEDVLWFLSGAFDDARCARLLAGLVWAKPTHLKRVERPPESLAFAYAALKPLFTPNATLRAEKILPEGARLPVPPGLIARLRTNRTDPAIRAALARARASGLASPFDPARMGDTKTLFGAGLEGDRLAAALLIPISPTALKKLIAVAYEDPKDDETPPTEPAPSEETTDAA